ncbi:sce7726 family protein [Magnetococcus sp. PR-3]|uniref:sce7726 family protein n=1 Tax=Magnetococcus sp. PR-3 TaxID=3120355 RepID=UPI002FCE10C8
MQREQSELSALTRLFSSAVFRELAEKGRSPMFVRLLDQLDFLDYSNQEISVGDLFELAFSELKKFGCRDEYIYRSAVTKKVLLGKHSLNTASMLTEFRVGSSRADLVILNGTATVYEIKSERDSLSRLNKQIEDYQKVFASVNVITAESHVDDVVERIPDGVGVLSLSRRYQISVYRDAIEQTEKICPATVLLSLRAVEAINILRGLGVDVPDVPNTQRYEKLRELFVDLDRNELHRQMVTVLKKNRALTSLCELIKDLPESLHAAALSKRMSRKNHSRLIKSVDTPLKTALTWS